MDWPNLQSCRAIPLYAGIEKLSKEGDNLQWGGPTLFANGKFATPDGTAHFSTVAPKQRRAPQGMFYLSTRRGKQMRSVRPHTRLIILTYESTPSDVLDSMRAHAFSFFSVPYREDYLIQMIRFAVESPTWDDGIELISGTPEWIRIRASCQERTANRLMQFLNEMSELPLLEREQVGSAFRELLMNAIEHGCQLDPEKHLEIEYVRTKHNCLPNRRSRPGIQSRQAPRRHRAFARRSQRTHCDP